MGKSEVGQPPKDRSQTQRNNEGAKGKLEFDVIQEGDEKLEGQTPKEKVEEEKDDRLTKSIPAELIDSNTFFNPEQRLESYQERRVGRQRVAESMAPEDLLSEINKMRGINSESGEDDSIKKRRMTCIQEKRLALKERRITKE